MSGEEKSLKIRLTSTQDANVWVMNVWILPVFTSGQQLSLSQWRAGILELNPNGALDKDPLKWIISFASLRQQLAILQAYGSICISKEGTSPFMCCPEGFGPYLKSCTNISFASMLSICSKVVAIFFSFEALLHSRDSTHLVHNNQPILTSTWLLFFF